MRYAGDIYNLSRVNTRDRRVALSPSLSLSLYIIFINVFCHESKLWPVFVRFVRRLSREDLVYFEAASERLSELCQSATPCPLTERGGGWGVSLGEGACGSESLSVGAGFIV